MPPLILVLPAYLTTIRHSVTLSISLRGFDRCARVDEEQAGHCESDNRGRDGARVYLDHRGREVTPPGFGLDRF